MIIQLFDRFVCNCAGRESGLAKQEIEELEKTQRESTTRYEFHTALASIRGVVVSLL